MHQKPVKSSDHQNRAGDAIDINDSGLILAAAWLDGVPHSVILTLVPAPAAAAALLLGVVPVLRRRHRA